VSRDWRLYLDDIVDAATLVQEFTRGLSKREFLDDLKTYHAVIRNLEILGEAAKKLQSDVCEQAPDVPWRQLAGFRDRLAHGYFDMDDDVIWSVIQEHLAILKAEAERLRDPGSSTRT
jgi:uncharacterized protein with HEPN domain